jgi:hypothetical protein
MGKDIRGFVRSSFVAVPFMLDYPAILAVLDGYCGHIFSSNKARISGLDTADWWFQVNIVLIPFLYRGSHEHADRFRDGQMALHSYRFDEGVLIVRQPDGSHVFLDWPGEVEVHIYYLRGLDTADLVAEGSYRASFKIPRRPDDERHLFAPPPLADFSAAHPPSLYRLARRKRCCLAPGLRGTGGEGRQSDAGRFKVSMCCHLSTKLDASRRGCR